MAGYLIGQQQRRNERIDMIVSELRGLIITLEARTTKTFEDVKAWQAAQQTRIDDLTAKVAELAGGQLPPDIAEGFVRLSTGGESIDSLVAQPAPPPPGGSGDGEQVPTPPAPAP